MRILDRTELAVAVGYISYQEKVTNQHLLPLFQKMRVPLERPILDVGCGTGGCAIALAAALAAPVTAIDVLEENIAAGQQEAAAAGVPVDFQVMDINEDRLPDKMYGLILLRDVIEHLTEPQAALARLRSKLATGGYLYVSFPPWYGPYAGHQHNAKSAVCFMPYLHAISPSLFLYLLHRCEQTRKDWLMDERQIVANRLSRRTFEDMIAHTAWKVAYSKSYLLRPAFTRMGLPTVSNGWVGRIPWLGECLTTGCEYLLTL